VALAGPRPGAGGTRHHSGHPASAYGFTDLGGSRPDVWRFIEAVRERNLEAGYDDYR